MIKSITKKVKKLFQNENTVPIILTLIITVFAISDAIYWNHIGLDISWSTVFLLLLFFFLIIYLYAGTIVIKSLFSIAAGLSLIIFISQSYCAVPRNNSSDQALNALIIASFLYLTLVFVRDVYKEFVRHYKLLKKDNVAKDIYFISGIFAISTLFFIVAVYDVIYPIISSLCIYQ